MLVCRKSNQTYCKKGQKGKGGLKSGLPISSSAVENLRCVDNQWVSTTLNLTMSKYYRVLNGSIPSIFYGLFRKFIDNLLAHTRIGETTIMKKVLHSHLFGQIGEK